eukprot:351281-Chlamydomonas_euryale.AAC.7
MRRRRGKCNSKQNNGECVAARVYQSRTRLKGCGKASEQAPVWWSTRYYVSTKSCNRASFKQSKLMGQLKGGGSTKGKANRVPRPRIQCQNWPARRRAERDALEAILLEKSMVVIPKGHDPALLTLVAQARPKQWINPSLSIMWFERVQQSDRIGICRQHVAAPNAGGETVKAKWAEDISLEISMPKMVFHVRGQQPAKILEFACEQKHVPSGRVSWKGMKGGCAAWSVGRVADLRWGTPDLGPCLIKCT